MIILFVVMLFVLLVDVSKEVLKFFSLDMRLFPLLSLPCTFFCVLVMCHRCSNVLRFTVYNLSFFI